MTASAQNRNPIVDASKGLAILLVVLGHAVQAHTQDFDRSLLFRFICSFHMALFFFLSGWVFNPNSHARIKKTILRLLPPVASWYMLSYILGGFYKIESLPNYLARFLARPDAGLWFLWVLAFGLLAMMAGRLLELRIGRVAYLFLIVLFFIAPIRYLGVPLLRYYFPCIVTGYLLRNAVVDMKRFLPYVLPISLVVFVAVFPFWHRTYEQVTAPAQVIIEGHQLSIRPFVYIGAKYAEACSGSALAVWTAFLLYNYLRMTLLQWLGRRSLEIYVSHQLFIYAFPARSAIAIAGAFCFALAMSLIVIQVIGRIPGARELLYGVPWMSCEMQAPNPGNVEEQCTQLALPANLRGAYWNK